jgi:hypothetical protein
MLTSAAFLANGMLYVTTPDNWRSLDSLILASLEAPNLVEGSDILRFNLSKTGMPLTGVTAVKVEPAIRRSVEKTFRIDAWGRTEGRQNQPHAESQ